MITFTDPRLYVMGIGTGIMTDIATGNIRYFSDKMQEGNVVPSATDNVLNAGPGNGPVIDIPTDPNVTVTVTAADYNAYVKAASVGSVLEYGAPVMTCEEITASGAALTVSETPVAGLGDADPYCYVQEVGAASPIAADGTAYEFSGSVVDGFSAVIGKTYRVTYYVTRANASLTTIGSNVKGEVVRFVFQRPIFFNVDAVTRKGDLWGMLYEIIPRLQLMPDGASNNGSQSSYTTTGITGRAMQYDAETIEAGGCDDCVFEGAPLMYRVIVPCDQNTGIEGILGILGGTVNLAVGETFQLKPAVVVNGKLSYNVPASQFAYVSASTAVATVGASTGLITAASAGSTQITVTYSVGDATYSDILDVTVVSA